jgi:hypothetical protein
MTDATLGNASAQLINLSIITSYQSFILAAFAIVACLICIWIVFIFGRNLQISANLRSALVQSVAKQEFEAPYRELLNRAISEPLDPNDPPPLEFGPVAQLWEPRVWIPYTEKLKEPIFFGPGDKEKDEDREKRLKALALCVDWEKRERSRFAELKRQLEREAKEKAEQSVPKSMDMSLLGSGFSFLLEFSAVIVIIFTLMTLGILEVLDGKDITTILASIAGYVLGKAGTMSKGDTKELKEQQVVEKSK